MSYMFDCVAVRLTLDRRFATRSPSNVMIVPAPGAKETQNRSKIDLL